MAAEEGVSKSEIVTGFLLGQRHNVSDPKEIKKYEFPDIDDTHAIVGEEAARKELIALGDTSTEDLEGSEHCEVAAMMTQGKIKECPNVATVMWTAPENFQFAGHEFWLCDKHLKEVSQ
jgi:hypothetical protein